MTATTGMELRAALKELRAVRQDRDVVITTMGPAREWMALGPSHPLDLVLVPSAMGHATSWGLGLALARPDHRVIVVNGDGSMLMNLGSLVTIMAQRPPNLIVIVCDNGGYEVTGAQPTAGAAAGRVGGDRVDFLALARGAGFEQRLHCPTFEAWTRALPTLWDRPGPGFVLLDIQLVPETPGPRSPGPAGPRGQALMAAFRTNS